MHHLISFHGTDHKVGTTMITQSVAEIIAGSCPDLKILFLAMNGRDSADFFREATAGIDTMKFHIDNRMVSGEEFLKTCTHKGNHYMMAGITNETEARYYMPTMAAYLLEEVVPEFDLVLSDCGNDLDNGLAVGTLQISGEIYLVAAQQESSLRRLEKTRTLMQDLRIDISGYLINKYQEQDPYGLAYLSGRMEAMKDQLIKISASEYSRQAEQEYRTLLEYRNEAYKTDILSLANQILIKQGIPEIKKQRKSKWRSFI
jgi:cellulose biosynthesis protein BcsQ